MTTTTRLSDIVEPSVFYNYMSKDTTEKTDIFKSGALRMDAELAAKLAGGGTTFQVPFWKDLDSAEADIGSDDPAVEGVPAKLSSGKDIAVRQLRTKGFSTADLSGVIAGSDPMMRIRERVNAFWDRQFQTTMVRTMTGVYLSNVASNSSDMIHSVATDSSSSVADAELIDADKIIDAAYTMGDNAEGLKILVMHSTIMKRLAKLDLITFQKDSTGQMTIPYYLGKRVVVDDNCRTETGTYRVKYTTYLLGEGSIGWAESALPNGVAVERDEAAGNGMGIETLWTRRQFAMHPYGIKWTGTTMAANFPSWSELALSANWSRVYSERKQIPIAFLVTNG